MPYNSLNVTLHTLASFSVHVSMNMQMIPASTHSQQLRDPLVDDHTLSWLVTR